MSALNRWKQEGRTFKAIFSYVVRSKPTWATQDLVLKEKERKSKPLVLFPPFSVAISQLLFLNIGTFDLDKFMSP